MNITAKLLIAFFLVCTLNQIRAQTTVEVSPPELSLKSGKVLIDFNLLNSTRSENFSIRISISNENEELIPAKALSGDIGKGVQGGDKKRIIWDLEADGIFLDGDIFVEVFALQETPPLAVIHPDEEQENTEATEAVKEYKRSVIILQSIALPGLGLSRINPGKPHWLKGVAAYGCLGTSVYLNRKAWSGYQDYLDPDHTGSKEELFNQADNTKKTSQILGYAAIGIWVADLAWTILGTSDMSKNHLSDNQKGLSIGTRIEPMSSTPLVALRYVF